jgi:hypothetical protein
MGGKNQRLWNRRRRRKGSGTNQVEGPGWAARRVALPGPAVSQHKEHSGAGSEIITQGDWVEIPSESLLDFTLQQDASIPGQRG